MHFAKRDKWEIVQFLYADGRASDDVILSGGCNQQGFGMQFLCADQLIVNGHAGNANVQFPVDEVAHKGFGDVFLYGEMSVGIFHAEAFDHAR